MRNLNVLLCTGLSLALIGCGGETLPRASIDPPKEMFDAQLVENLQPGALVKIDSEIKNNVDVEVVVYPDDPAIPGNEVAVDYARTGWSAGPDEDTAKEDASLEADNNLRVTLLPEHNNVKISVKAGKAAPFDKDRVILHVRVPARAQLAVELAAGNIEIAGDLMEVNASTKNGNITVRGATGSLTLKTDRGNIRVDDLRYKAEEQGILDLEAADGNIEIYAVNVSAKARTTKGNVRFVGSLAEGLDNSFVTTENGQITLALPSDLPYSFTALGGKQVLNDFTPKTLVCGDAQDSMIDFHAQKTPQEIGHTSVGKWITNTDYVTGTMIPDDYFLFHTNRRAVSKFIPQSAADKKHSGALLPPECDKPDHKDDPTKTHFTVQAGKGGIIEVRFIRKH